MVLENVVLLEAPEILVVLPDSSSEEGMVCE